jgi:hypothetical protein
MPRKSDKLSPQLSKLEDFIFSNPRRIKEFFKIYDSLYTGEYIDDIEYMAFHNERIKATLKLLKSDGGKYHWNKKTQSWFIKK